MSRIQSLAGWLVASALAVTTLAVNVYAGPTTPAQVNGGVYNATPPTLSDGQTGVFQFDANGQLKVAATASLTNPTVGAAVPATANYVAGNKGGLLTGLTLDGSSNLNVNCAAGCSSSATNFGDPFPASGSAIGMSQGGNLTALSGSGGNLLVALGAAIPAGANNIGTVNAAQSGTWTVQPGNTANTTPWLVTGSGTAGSAATGVLTVQGIASMTPVQVSQATASNLNAQVVGSIASGASDSGNPVKIGGVYNSTKPTFTDGQRGDIQLGTRGAVNMTLFGENSATSVQVASPSDTGTNSFGGLGVNAYGALWDTTQWTRARAAINGTNSTGTGIAASQAVVQCDDTSPTAITENSFFNARGDCTDHTQAIGGLVTTNAPSYTTGTARGASLTTAGLLRVSIADTAANTNAFVVTGNVTPADALALGTTSVSTTARMSLYNGTNTDLAREFVAAADSTGTGIQATATYGQFDDASTATVTENRVAPVRMNSDRAQLVQPVPSASQVNGLSTSSITAFANSENETEAKATAGAVYGFSVSNNSATIAYLTFYNSAAAGTTCGTNELYNFIIPASTSGAGNNVVLPFPIPFSTAISYCITTGIGGTGSVAANSGTAVVWYK